MLKKIKPTIGIIDSGIGGVSVLNQLIKKFNGGNYIYFADNLFMPYGRLKKSVLNRRLKEIIKILNSFKVDLIIIACNTASCVLEIDNTANIVTMEFNKDYTYFATVLTKNTLKEYNVIADNNLAKEIEDHIFNKSYLNKLIYKNIKAYKLNKINSLVLACTHYELVEDIFKKYCPKTKIFSNSKFIIDKIDVDMQEKNTNVYIMLSKPDINFYKKLVALINK